MEFKIYNAEIQNEIAEPVPEFPKYSTQIINLANQNAQGTRPRVVGQLSELIQEFPGRGYSEWVRWYSRKMPNAIDDAVTRIVTMKDNLKQAMSLIDEEMIRLWVGDLVLAKTFIGLKFQEAILKRLAKSLQEPYRLSSASEESAGIDGYIGRRPVSIKPSTYRSKRGLSETIDVPIVFYTKDKDGISVQVDWS